MEMSKANILVVDDEPKVVDIVRGYLERDGYRVSAAASGPQALEEFGRSAPDLVVLDIMLPGLDGIEVLREIRRKFARSRHHAHRPRRGRG
jgi:CheY-like chemotaxis protein